MDYERLLDDIAAYYALVKAEHPGFPSDGLVTLIADRIGLDAELSLATAERSAGTARGWTTIQRFVYAMEDDEYGQGWSP